MVQLDDPWPGLWWPWPPWRLIASLRRAKVRAKEKAKMEEELKGKGDQKGARANLRTRAKMVVCQAKRVRKLMEKGKQRRAQ